MEAREDGSIDGDLLNHLIFEQAVRWWWVYFVVVVVGLWLFRRWRCGRTIDEMLAGGEEEEKPR